MWIYILILVLPSTGQWFTLWAERGARKFLAWYAQGVTPWYALVLLGLLYLKLIAVINGDPITVNTSNKINIL